MKTYKNTKMIATSQKDDDTTGCYYNCQINPTISDEKQYKTIAKGYSQQKALDADAKEIQQINFDLNLNQT